MSMRGQSPFERFNKRGLSFTRKRRAINWISIRLLALFAITGIPIFAHAQATTVYSYNGSNQLIQAISSLGAGVRYAYDAAGNMVAVTALTPQQVTPGSTGTATFANPGESALLILNVSAGQPANELTVGGVNPSDSLVTISVYDSTGTLIQSFTGTSGGSINLAGLAAGTYSIIVTPSAGVAGTAQLAVSTTLPSLAQCAAPDYGLYIAGSPAAQTAFQTVIASDLFGDAAKMTIFSATHGNFQAYCGFASPTNSAGIPTSSVITIHYRGEGETFVGTVPLAVGNPINFLDLTQAAQISGSSVTVIGSSEVNDIDDSWSGAVAPHNIDVGISEVEPPLTNSYSWNYPSLYSQSVYGSANAWPLIVLPGTPVFQQVFGLFVNTAGINGGGSNQPIGLTSPGIFNILIAQYQDWSVVPSTTGGAVSNVPMPITVIHHVSGSGARTAAELYFLSNGCNSYAGSAPIDSNYAADVFSTIDALALANDTPGSITYASIDYNGLMPNLTMASLNGIAPSSQAAASGLYKWWYETTIQAGNITSPHGTILYNWLLNELSSLATMPHTAQVMAIPGQGSPPNPATLPLTSSTSDGQTVYVNPYTRQGNSCLLPTGANQ